MGIPTCTGRIGIRLLDACVLIRIDLFLEHINQHVLTWLLYHDRKSLE